MKVVLYSIFLACLMAQIPSESMGMKRGGDDLAQPQKKRRKVVEAPVQAAPVAPEAQPAPAPAPADPAQQNEAAAAPAQVAPVPVAPEAQPAPAQAQQEAAVAVPAAPEDRRCSVCFCNFDSKAEDGSVVTQIKCYSCSNPICENCLKDCLAKNPGVCPQCNAEIKDIKILKDPIIFSMLKRKRDEALAKERREQAAERERQEAERERVRREQEDARVKEQIRLFSSGGDMIGYLDVPADAKILVGIYYAKESHDYRDEGNVMQTTLPILHFLAICGSEKFLYHPANPQGSGAAIYNPEYKDAVELVKYFVEEKGVDVNQKAELVNFTFPVDGRVFSPYVTEDSKANLLEGHFINCTAEELAEIAGNVHIAEYLKNRREHQAPAPAAAPAAAAHSSFLSRLNPFKKS